MNMGTYRISIAITMAVLLLSHVGCGSNDNTGTDIVADEVTIHTQETQITDQGKTDSGCVPKCDNKKCGDDGCGGSCGTCTRPMACEGHQCIIPGGCKELPYSWGGATFLYSLQLVDSSDAKAMKVCADFNDDGRPDNGFGSANRRPLLKETMTP